VQAAAVVADVILFTVQAIMVALAVVVLELRGKMLVAQLREPSILEVAAVAVLQQWPLAPVVRV